MNKYLEAPHIDFGLDQTKSRIFLAGGITGVPDWQKIARERLEKTDAIILNPRRASFDMSNKSAAEVQIEWEFWALKEASIILFWFPEEQIQPIALFELGRWSASPKPIVVGTHPNYPRRQDVVIQMRLIRPSLVVHDTLEGTLDAL